MRWWQRRLRGAGSLAALAWLACGCGSTQVTAASKRDAETLAAMPDTPGALIQMRRGGCAPNQCPIYGVSIFMDGTVTYDGRANVAVAGQRRAKLTAARVNELISTIEKMDFLDSPERCCVCLTPSDESHMIIIDYRPGSAQKTVIHDADCPSAPIAMTALEEQIDQAIDVKQWTAPVVVAAKPPAAPVATTTTAPPPLAPADGEASTIVARSTEP